MNQAENTPKKQLPDALKKNMWVKGQSGNPAGRPKGSISVIDTIRHIWEADPEQFQTFVDKYLEDPRNRQHIVEMIDGKPKGSETNVAVQVNNFSIPKEDLISDAIEILEQEYGGVREFIKSKEENVRL